LIKGIGAIKKKTDEAIANQSKNRILQIKLKDGEAALLRFLTEPDSVISAEFHSVKDMTPKGEWRVSRYCSQDSSCKYCAEGSTTGEQIFLWAYCYYILHKQQNPRLDTDSNASRWKRVKVGEEPFFQEEINAPRIFKTGPGKGYVYKTTLIKYANEYGTYMDRDYKWFREGAQKENTSYTLMPKDPKPLSEEIKEVIKTLPDLTKVVNGEIFSFDQVKNEGAEDIEEIKEIEKVEVKKSFDKDLKQSKAPIAEEESDNNEDDDLF